jgi:hypothetical protein
MHGADDARLGGVFFDAFAKLGDVLVEGAALGEEIDAPDLVGEGIAIDDLASAVMEEAQELRRARCVGRPW